MAPPAPAVAFGSEEEEEEAEEEDAEEEEEEEEEEAEEEEAAEAEAAASVAPVRLEAPASVCSNSTLMAVEGWEPPDSSINFGIQDRNLWSRRTWKAR